MRKMNLFDRPCREGLPYRLKAGHQRELYQPLIADWITEPEWKKGGEIR